MGEMGNILTGFLWKSKKNTCKELSTVRALASYPLLEDDVILSFWRRSKVGVSWTQEVPWGSRRRRRIWWGKGLLLCPAWLGYQFYRKIEAFYPKDCIEGLILELRMVGRQCGTKSGECVWALVCWADRLTYISNKVAKMNRKGHMARGGNAKGDRKMQVKIVGKCLEHSWPWQHESGISLHVFTSSCSG